MDSKQAAPDLFPETHDILFRAVRLFDVGVSMRLNILHFQNCFGFYCLALVVLSENKKVIRDNVSSKLRVRKTEAIFREWVSLLGQVIRQSSSNLFYLDISK